MLKSLRRIHFDDRIAAVGKEIWLRMEFVAPDYKGNIFPSVESTLGDLSEWSGRYFEITFHVMVDIYLITKRQDALKLQIFLLKVYKLFILNMFRADNIIYFPKFQ